MWDYIKTNKLQDPQNKREIMADDKLRPVFGKERAFHVRDEQTPCSASDIKADASQLRPVALRPIPEVRGAGLRSCRSPALLLLRCTKTA